MTNLKVTENRGFNLSLGKTSLGGIEGEIYPSLAFLVLKSINYVSVLLDA